MQIHIVGGGAWPLCTLCCGFGCALHLCCICIRTATSVKLLSRCHSTCFGQHSCTCPPTDGQVAKATQHTLQSPRAAGHHSMSGFYCVLAMNKSISGLVAEYIVAIDVTRIRFPADAFDHAWMHFQVGRSHRNLKQCPCRLCAMSECPGRTSRDSSVWESGRLIVLGSLIASVV